MAASNPHPRDPAIAEDVRLEETLAEIAAARAALRKADLGATRAVGASERLRKVDHALQHELMMKRSIGYRRSQQNRAEEERLRAANMAGRDLAA
jgi:hypothetical protein